MQLSRKFDVQQQCPCRIEVSSPYHVENNFCTALSKQCVIIFAPDTCPFMFWLKLYEDEERND